MRNLNTWTAPLWAAAFGLLSASNLALAEEAIDLISICADTSMALETRQDAGAALTHIDPLRISADQAEDAISCLHDIFGADFVYNGFAVYSPELDAEAASEKRSQMELEAASQKARREELSAAIKKSCFSELTDDRFRALTTPACQEVFLEFGLTD